MINVIQEPSGAWMVWTDTECGYRDGRCIGCGATKAEALIEAVLELRHELSYAEQLLARESLNDFSRGGSPSEAGDAQAVGTAGAHNPASDGRAGEISRVYSCPECGDDVTFPHEHVNYAECPNCHGYWYASSDAEFVDGMWKDLTKLLKANPDPEAP